MSTTQLRQRKSGKDEEIKESVSPSVNATSQVVSSQIKASAEREKKIQSIITRTIWGFLMIFVFTGILLTDHMLVCVFVVILQVIVFKEVIALRYIEAKEKNLWGFRTIHWFMLFATFFYFYGDFFLTRSQGLLPYKTLDTLSRYHIIGSFSLYIAAFLGFIVSFRNGLYKYQLGQIAWTVMMLLNVVVQSHFILLNIFRGLIWFIIPTTLIICNDVMAYFWGLLLGKRFVKRPLTSLSPNKTWEGFIGAVFTTIIYAFIGSWVYAQFDWFICPKDNQTQSHIAAPLHCTPSPIFLPADYEVYYPSPLLPLLKLVGIESDHFGFNVLPIQLHAVVFSLFASLIAPFGGFFASAMKRAYGIKDFGSLFPGHGGMTDRMDCQFIMGLFVYVYYTAFIKNSLYDYSQVESAVTQLSPEDQLKMYDMLGRSLGRII